VLLTAQTLLTGRELLRPGWIEVSGETVLGLGAGAPPRPADRALDTVVPGFVDTHVHGGGGSDFSAATRADTVAATELHRRHGTTTLIASLVSAGPADLVHQVEVLADQVRDGLIAGVHLEGPWLAVSRCGAHDPMLLRDPDAGELERVLQAGAGTIRMVTLAPERPGGVAAIARIVAAGAVAAVGHTEATYEQTRTAIAAGATVGTHLFNAMRSIHHREPGPVIALLEDPRVTVELIADGVHVDAALYRHVTRAAGPDRLSLITDAMAAAGAGAGAGRYRIGRKNVEVTDGVANLAGTSTIAGSTATMDRVFRFAVAHSGLPHDEALLSAVRQSSLNPARALGLPPPVLAAGARADLVALDAELAVTDVLHGGVWVSR
jgi:N-acetylglucosamine-6-phosphate deacetylase